MSDSNKNGAPPDTANQSVFTALSGDKDATHTSPATSPVIERTSAEDTNVNVNINVSARLALDQKFDNVLKEKLEEIISIISELSEKSETNDTKLKELSSKEDSQADFDWKKLLKTIEDIFNRYSLQMHEFTKEFDDLNKDFLIWQESAYIMDSEKVSKRLGTQEQWISAKESYLNYKKKELSKSAKLIDNALDHLRSGNQ